MLIHTDMAACTIFDEDEVCIPILSGGFKYGLVVESSEYNSSDDEDCEIRVHQGQVKIAWHPNGEETVVSEKKLILTDRCLIPGDVVRRLIDGEESQRGYVLDSHIKCHVKVLATEQYIYNIDAKYIKPIQEWDSEEEVTLDSWVGNVLEVNEELTVQFPCGARCRLSNPDILDLEDVHDKRDHHSAFGKRSYYPGQELASSYEDFQDAIWIHTTNKRGPDTKSKSIFNAHVIVKEMKTVSVDVHWVCKGFSHPGDSIDHLQSPPNFVEGENLKRLKRLDLLEHCHLQIGDKGYYVITESDIILHKVSPGKHVTPDIIELADKENIVHGVIADGLISKQRGINKSNAEKLVDKNGDLEPHGNKQDEIHALDKDKINGNDAVVNADKDVDEIEDQCSDSDSHSNHSGAEFTGSLRKKKKHAARATKLHKKSKKKTVPFKSNFQPGDKVPIEIWYTFSTCDVIWQDGTVEYGVPSPELFPIHHLDEHEYFPGDFVVDAKVSYGSDYGVIISCNHKERTVMVKWMKPSIPGKSTKPEVGDKVELSVFDIKDHLDYTFRCGDTVIRVGGYEDDSDLEAVGLVFRPDPDGTIHVWWPSGAITKCHPQDLYIVSDEYDSESGSSEEWSEEEEVLESNESWETADELSASESDGDEKKKSEASWTVSESKKKEIDAMLERAQAALASLLNILINVSASFFKNSRQAFKDILTIFKRCKQFEDILKTSFLENNEIFHLISEVKDEYQKEKADEFARHVAQVYKFRTTDGTAEDLKKVIDVSTEKHVNKEELAKKTADEVEGAVGRRTDDSKDFTRLDKMKKVLSDYGSDIDDPIMQIIFDTSLLATIAECTRNGIESTKSNVARAYTVSAACAADPLNIGDTESCAERETLKHGSVMNIIHTILDSVCDPDDYEMKKNFEAVKQRVVEAYNVDGQFSCDNLNEDSESSQSTATEAGVHFAQNSVENSKTKDAIMKSNQKELCIRVCKALNIQLMHIQQDLHRKWLATKYGFDKDATDFEVLEKMQTETLESVKNSSEKPQVKSEKHAQSEVTDVECVKELDAVEKISTSSVTEMINETDMENVKKTDTPKVNKTDTDENKTYNTLITGDNVERKGFVVCSETPFCHKYKCREHKSSNQKTFSSAIRKEWLLLRSNLPDGIHVKVFEDRMDLFSVLIKGPANTPYEGGLFIFDIQVPSDFPNRPPELFYHSYCNERLNPNLYQDGKVCVSLLGTWSGKGNELWTSKSSVLQVLVSIQGLILVSEPYFNEAGYEKQRGTQHGQENSRMYNEMVVLKVVQSMTMMAVNPPEIFLEETINHLKNHALKMIERIEGWIEISKKHRMEESQRANNVNHSATLSFNLSITDHASKSTSENSLTTNEIEHCMDTKQDLSEALKPGFPLMPASKGFCLSMQQHLQYFRESLDKQIFNDKLEKN